MDPFRPSRVPFTGKDDFAFLGSQKVTAPEQKGAIFVIVVNLAPDGVLEPSVDCKKVSGVVPEQVPGGSESV